MYREENRLQDKIIIKVSNSPNDHPTVKTISEQSKKTNEKKITQKNVDNLKKKQLKSEQTIERRSISIYKGVRHVFRHLTIRF